MSEARYRLVLPPLTGERAMGPAEPGAAPSPSFMVKRNHDLRIVWLHQFDASRRPWELRESGGFLLRGGANAPLEE